MSIIALAVSAVLSAGPAPALAPAVTMDPSVILAQAQPFVGSQGVSAPRGNYMTTPEGCTYRRTQAPGHPPQWIIVLNPHHLGLPASPRTCKGMM